MLRWLYFAGIVTVVFICFLSDIRGQFLDWDDIGYVVENDLVTGFGISSALRAFTETRNYYWAPLTWISLGLDHAVWGLNPLGYHLTNNALHALNSGILFLVAASVISRNLDRDAGPETCYNPLVLTCALFAALAWGVHPLRVESVAWIAERKDVLSSFFGLLSLLAYLKYADGRVCDDGGGEGARRATLYWTAVALYALSMMSKAMLMTLPLALLVIDWSPLRRLRRDSLRSLVFEKAPFFIITVIVSAITANAMAYSSKSLTEIDMASRIIIACKSLVFYLQLTLWPVNISPVYFHPGNTRFDGDALTAALVLAAITLLAVAMRSRTRTLLASWLLYVIIIFPVLGLAQSGPTELAARFSYVPTMPLFLVAAAGLAAIIRHYSHAMALRVIILCAALSVTGLLAFFTQRDFKAWQSDITLWSRVIELQPRKFGKAYYQRALFHIQAGDYRSALPDASQALAIALEKKYADVHEIYALRARIRWVLQDAVGAIEDYSAAIESTDPMHGVVYYEERGSIWQAIGEEARAQQDFEQARRSREWK